jgi:sulfoxide reductase heme-binding subunit YedZ
MILALTQTPSPLWYFARAAGFVSLILLAFTVGLGLALTLRWRTDSWPTFISDGLHRYLATVFFVFVFIHVETLLLDPFTKFTLSDLLIPFVSTYRPFWMAMGICAAELALALALSVNIRRWIGYRAWRVMHYGTYATFPLVIAHGLGTGSDTRTGWGLAIYIVCGSAVTGLAAARFFGGRAETEAEADQRRAGETRPVSATLRD